jgi:hypothetical protein
MRGQQIIRTDPLIQEFYRKPTLLDIFEKKKNFQDGPSLPSQHVPFLNKKKKKKKKKKITKS